MMPREPFLSETNKQTNEQPELSDSADKEDNALWLFCLFVVESKKYTNLFIPRYK